MFASLGTIQEEKASLLVKFISFWSLGRSDVSQQERGGEKQNDVTDHVTRAPYWGGVSVFAGEEGIGQNFGNDVGLSQSQTGCGSSRLGHPMRKKKPARSEAGKTKNLDVMRERSCTWKTESLFGFSFVFPHFIIVTCSVLCVQGGFVWLTRERW